MRAAGISIGSHTVFRSMCAIALAVGFDEGPPSPPSSPPSSAALTSLVTRHTGENAGSRGGYAVRIFPHANLANDRMQLHTTPQLDPPTNSTSKPPSYQLHPPTNHISSSPDSPPMTANLAASVSVSHTTPELPLALPSHEADAPGDSISTPSAPTPLALASEHVSVSGECVHFYWDVS